ncbi:TBC1 domain family member 23-like [Ciona intestinalis]
MDEAQAADLEENVNTSTNSETTFDQLSDFDEAIKQDVDFPSNDNWQLELEEMLNEGFVDQGIIKSVCKCRCLPDKFRTQVWKVCLNVANRGNAMASWDKKLDLPEQDIIRKDCSVLVESVMDESDPELTSSLNSESMIEDCIAVLTFYSKCRAVKYHTDNGWTSVLRPLLGLNLDLGDLYNCFYALQSRYVPRSDLSPSVTAAPFHLLRLLLLYHDPELCNFIDTCQISTQSFTSDWFCALFSSHCSPSVTCGLWDVYLQRSDPFFVFFLALVILVNTKEQIMANSGQQADRAETIKCLSQAPSVLTLEDVDDFCQLASYYSDKTPSSFRRDLGACFYSGAMISSTSKVDSISTDLAQSFCLKVSIPELLLSSQPSYAGDDEEKTQQIRYFVVDCRPAEEYNKGHLLTAFHLDATLMLKEPSEFDAALTSLFAAQDQAIQAGSAAGGEHLCFLGSGCDEDDQYMNMVIAHLLQKRQTYISVARGGFNSLLEYLTEVGIDLSEWVVGAERATPVQSKSTDAVNNGDPSNRSKMQFLMKKMAGNLMEKSIIIKDKVTRFIENTEEEWAGPERHIQQNDRSKPYRGTESVFSIGDDNENDEEGNQDSPGPSEEQHVEIEELSVWKTRPDVKHCFECQAVTLDGNLLPAHLVVTSDQMICLIEVKPKRGRKKPKLTYVKARPPRSLAAVVKITSRRSFPELITFKFGEIISPAEKEEEVEIVAADRYILPEAGTATKSIKHLIIEAEKKKAEQQKDDEAISHGD